MFKDQSITRTFLSVTVAITLFLCISTAIISFMIQYKGFEQAAGRYASEYMSNQKALIKNETERLIALADYETSKSKEHLKQDIKQYVEEAYDIALNIYNKNKDRRSEDEIKIIISDILSQIRHSKNSYYWIIDTHGNIIMHPFLKGKNIEILPENIKTIFKNTMQKVLNDPSGDFAIYDWKEPDQDILQLKISYTKFFKPYQWVISAGEYLQELEIKIQQEILEQIRQIHFGRNGYIRVFTFDGIVLSDPSGIFKPGENATEVVDVKGRKVVQHIVEAGLKPDGGYVSYVWNHHEPDKISDKALSRTSEKIVFSKAVHQWKWIIATGVFTDQIETVISEHRSALKKNVLNEIGWTLNLFLIVLMSGIFFAFMFSAKLRKEFQVFISFFNHVVSDHTPIDKDMLSVKELKLLADFANKMRDEIIISRQEFKKSEERYRSLIETIPHGIQDIDLHGNITFVNPAYHKLYGYDPGELTGKSMLDVIAYEADRKALAAHLKKLSEEQPMPAPYFGKNLKKDKTIIDVQVDWDYKRDAQGSVTGFISVITDITRRKQAEEEIRNLNRTLEQKVTDRTRELQETIAQLQQEIAERKRVVNALKKTEERLAKAQKIAHLGSWERNLETHEVVWQAETYDIFGLNPHRFSPTVEKILEYVHPEDRESNKKIIDDAIKNKTSVMFEQRIIRDDNTLRYLHVRCETICDDNGVPVRVVGTLQDITELKQAENALRTLSARYEVILSAVPDILAEVDSQKIIIWTNPAGFDFYGDDVLGKASAFYFEGEQDTYARVQPLFDGIKDDVYVESWQRRRDGEKRLLAWWCRALKNADGKVTGALSTGRDITDIRLAEESLKQAKEQAEAANLAKSEFLANMSHEIRTPMNAILGFTEILLSKVHDPRQKVHLNTILSSGQVLLALINDILDLSKIEAGRLELQNEPVDIRNMFKDIQRIFQQKVRENHIELNISIARQIPDFIIIDEIRLRQILINLMGNAVKFTHKGYVKLSAYGDFANADKSRFNLTICVEDTGIGISARHLEQIFEKFYQQDGQKTRKYGGTGLGLAITRKLVKMMKGEIFVESNVGKGTLFQIIFSSVECRKPLLSQTGEITDADGIWDDADEIHFEFEPATVLLVDDIYFNRELVKEYLTDTCLTVVEAESGEAALALLANKEKPDLILMDLKMPGMSGYEVTEIIKTNDELKHIPVIALTASAMKESEERIMKCFDAYLQKPVNVNQFMAALGKFLPCHSRLKQEKSESSEFVPDHLQATDREQGEETFSEEVKMRLPEMIERLDDEFIPRWKDIREAFFIDDITDFAIRLEDIATEYGIVFLTNYSQELHDQANYNNIDEIEKLMEQFPVIVDKIKNLR